MAKIKKILIPVFLFSLVVIFSLPSLKSGLLYQQGIGFWGPNGHDGVWHLSLINHISNPFSIPLPILSGYNLRNYHPFFDILAAFISHLIPLDSSIVLFQLLPLLISFGIIFISYLLSKRLFSKPSSWVLLPFFLVFTNSFGFLVTLFRSGSIGGESLFWSMQSPSIFFNPPLALSLFFILLLIYLVTLPFKKSHYVMAFLILSLLPITKAYSAPLAFSFFGLYSLYQLKKHNYFPFAVTLFSFLTAVGLYSIYNPLSNGLIIFSPFWFVTSMMDSPDRLYLPRISSALHTYQSSGQILKPTLIYLFAVPLFYLGNFGIRLFGTLRPRLKTNLHYYLLPAVIISSIIPLLFVQKGTSWNTIQFLYYPLFFSSIFLVNFIDNLPHNLYTQAFIAFLSILCLIPSINTYRQYITPTASSYLPREEIDALKFLSSQAPGIVLTYPYDKYAKKSLSDIHGLPLWAYETTSYVAAYSGHQVFLEDEMNLENSGFNWQERRTGSLSFFQQQSIHQDRGFLVNNQIDYIYLVASQYPKSNLNTQNMYLTKIFDNQIVQIFRVQR